MPLEIFRAARQVLVVAAAWFAGLAPTPVIAASPPNVVFILGDDHGYGDLGVQGSTDAQTPNLDRLAREGARFTDFYANHPICAPSRAGLMTARDQHRFGFENNRPMGPDSPNGLPTDVATVAELLKAQGYATGMTGKWHLGFQPRQAPTARGFDFYYGTLAGAMAYVPDGASGAKTLLRGTQVEPMPRHVTEAFGAEAVNFIEQHKHGPFFMYVSFTAVHAPLQTTREYLDRFADEKDPRRRTYLGMLAAMDDAVGNVVGAIDRNGLAENTLIIYTSDNGGPTWQTTSANRPLAGVKALTLEGGIRVPTIVRWKGRVPAGQVLSTMGIGYDLTATALAVGGVPLDESFDGVNLMPYLTGEQGGNAHDQLFWRMGPQGAVRDGPWKLVIVGDESWLFNLDDDMAEERDLSEVQAVRRQAMAARWAAWSDSMARPAFGLCAGISQTECRAQTPPGLVQLVRNYIERKPVNPRAYLYGGGPEG